MRSAVIAILSFVAAVIAPATLVVGWYTYGTFSVPGASSDPFAWVRIRNFTIPTLLVSTAHVVALGVPAFFLLQYFQRVTRYSTFMAGFVLGCLPMALFTWPLRYAMPGSSASHWANGKMVETMVNGVPTLAGWLSWGLGVGFMGVLGAIGGLAFWLVWRTHPNSSFKRTRGKSPRAA